MATTPPNAAPEWRMSAGAGFLKQCVADVIPFFASVAETDAAARDIAIEAIMAYRPVDLADFVLITRGLLLTLTTNAILRDARDPALKPAERLRFCDKAAKLSREANQVFDQRRRRAEDGSADTDTSLRDMILGMADADVPVGEPAPAPEPVAAEPTIDPEPAFAHFSESVATAVHATRVRDIQRQGAEPHVTDPIPEAYAAAIEAAAPQGFRPDPLRRAQQSAPSAR